MSMSKSKCFGVALRLNGLPKQESSSVNANVLFTIDSVKGWLIGGDGVFRLCMTNNSGCGTKPSK